jgi:regulation of enolase protein 1 (concanavalin A-like superfamily)
MSIDQIVLSHGPFLNAPPGAARDDGTVYAEQGGTSGGGSPPPAPSLPSGWSTADVGPVAAAGSVAYDTASQTFTVTGSGADIWGTADEFRFLYTVLRGDGSMVARVASVAGSEAWTKAGVMIRDSLTAGSKQASIFVSSGKGLAFQRRRATNGTSVHTSGPAAAAPYWIRLQRSGTTFTASVSADGAAWTVVGTDAISMAADVYVGLAVTSHHDGALATAQFDRVSVVP